MMYTQGLQSLFSRKRVHVIKSTVAANELVVTEGM